MGDESVKQAEMPLFFSFFFIGEKALAASGTESLQMLNKLTIC